MQVIRWANDRVSRLVADNVYRQPPLNRGGKKLAHSRERLRLLHAWTINVALQFRPLPLAALRAQKIPDVILSRRQAGRNQATLDRDSVEDVLVRNNGIVEINAENHAAHLTFNCC